MRRPRMQIMAWLAVGAGAMAGCASDKPADNKSTDVYGRQEAALKDPFHYSPDMGKTDISGGGIGDFDKDGMRKDLNDVFNP